MSENIVFDKILPCGMQLQIREFNGAKMLQADLIRPESHPEQYASVGAFFPGGNKSHLVIFINPTSLPAIQEALNLFVPARKWYQFWKSK